MRIDLHNYEAFFLDHLEGKLSEAQERELFAFLEEHPELKAVLENFEEVTLEPETVFESKDSLKKAEFGDEALIAYVEGEADAAAARDIEALALQNKAFGHELALYKSTVLKPGAEIKFPNKARLKKRGVVVYLSNPYLRVAAAVLLLLGLFFLVNRFTGTQVEPGKQPVLASTSKNNAVVPTKENNEKIPAKENKIAPALANAEEKLVADVQKNNKNENQVVIRTNGEVKKNGLPVQVNTNTVTVTNNENKDENTPQNKEQIPVRAEETPVTNSVADNATYKSYYNYSADDEEEDERPFVASTHTTASRKTFFQKLTNAARKVNALGVKKVNAEESDAKNSLTIGGLKVSESFSN